MWGVAHRGYHSNYFSSLSNGAALLEKPGLSPLRLFEVQRVEAAALSLGFSLSKVLIRFAAQTYFCCLPPPHLRPPPLSPISLSFKLHPQLPIYPPSPALSARSAADVLGMFSAAEHQQHGPRSWMWRGAGQQLMRQTSAWMAANIPQTLAGHGEVSPMAAEVHSGQDPN